MFSAVKHTIKKTKFPCKQYMYLRSFLFLLLKKKNNILSQYQHWLKSSQPERTRCNLIKEMLTHLHRSCVKSSLLQKVPFSESNLSWWGETQDFICSSPLQSCAPTPENKLINTRAKNVNNWQVGWLDMEDSNPLKRCCQYICSY